jgi:hypothetical protein
MGKIRLIMTLHIVPITGNTTLDGTHANMLLNVTASAVITIPKATTYDFTNSDKIRILRNTASAVSFTAASGVTLLTLGGVTAISNQNNIVQLEKTATDIWVLSQNI